MTDEVKRRQPPMAGAGEAWRPLRTLLEDNEAWLVDRFFHYASAHHYNRYTSTLRSAGTMTAAGLTESLLQAMDTWTDIPDLAPDEDYRSDPAASFGRIQARRHRERGVSLTMFLGMLKYFRQAYQDLVRSRDFELQRRRRYHLFVERVFDRLELAFLSEWSADSQDHLLAELQDSNRRLANEKNKYLTLFESIASPALFVAPTGRLENLNQTAAALFLGEEEPGAVYYQEGGLKAHLPWLPPLLAAFERAGGEQLDFERKLNTTRGLRHYQGKLRRMLDTSDKFQGTIVTLSDVTPREQARAQLQQAHDQLEQRVRERTAELQATNQRLRAEMTERRRTEQEKDRIQAALLHSQKLRAVGKLAGGVAHDLNNLLQMIMGNTELMELQLPAESNLSILSEQVLEAAERASALVRQLLLFSRKQPMRFQPLDLNSTVRGMVRMLERILGEDIQVTTELSTQLDAIEGDPGSLEQVIMNLVVNARDSMPAGGTITIRSERVHFSREDEGFPEVVSGRYACLEIIDEGGGMDQATQERAFEPFFSTKDMGQGTGLGLSVVHGIVEKHGGWIRLYSRPGMGSSFKVYLPTLETSAQPPSPSRTRDLAQLHGAGEHLLVVEDEAGVRGYTAGVLERAGYQVTEAADAQEALAAVERHEIPFAVLISDVILPGMNGPELLAVIRERHPQQRVLFTSGYTAGEWTETLGEDAALALLPKPYALRELLAAVQRLLEAEPG